MNYCKKKSNKNRKINIIGGQWKGRKITVPNILGLRPTTNKAREMLFNWLAPTIVGARCLDCFAGSGALGIEAISRCACNVVLLEKKYSLVQNLKKNLLILNINNARIINIDVFVFLTKPGDPYDIVFIDPPFYKGFLEETFFLLEDNGWLSTKAFIYAESEIIKGIPIKTPNNWNLLKSKVTKNVFYSLYHRTK